MSGYSGTSLVRKLGLKDGQSVAFAGLPPHLRALEAARDFGAMQSVEDWAEVTGEDLDYIHLFTDSAATVANATPAMRARLDDAGMFWVSWPKKASGVPSDVTEDVIRDHALRDVLVDVKVCAVDEVWSGLKLMIRKELRAGRKKRV